MARLIIALLVILPAILATERRAYPTVPSSFHGAGALAARYGRTRSESGRANWSSSYTKDQGSIDDNAAMGIYKPQRLQVGRYRPPSYVPPQAPHGYPQFSPYASIPQPPQPIQYPQYLSPQGPGVQEFISGIGGPYGGVQTGAGVGRVRY